MLYRDEAAIRGRGFLELQGGVGDDDEHVDLDRGYLGGGRGAGCSLRRGGRGAAAGRRTGGATAGTVAAAGVVFAVKPVLTAKVVRLFWKPTLLVVGGVSTYWTGYIPVLGNLEVRYPAIGWLVLGTFAVGMVAVVYVIVLGVQGYLAW